MEKIFYADKTALISSTDAIEKILEKHFGILNAKLSRTKNGKPYLEEPNDSLFFSVTHTKKLLFIVFSDKNVGADAELLDRKVAYKSILRRFPEEERAQIRSTQSFLCRWTIKESAIKWLGGTIANDLEKLSFVNNSLCYKGEKLPVCVTPRLFEGHVLAICCENDFSSAPFIPL